MIRFGKPEEVEQYFDFPAANQSLLKKLPQGVEDLDRNEKKMYYEEKGHLIIGSAVDTYLTMGEDVYNSVYHKTTCSKPSDTIVSIVKMVFDEVSFSQGGVKDLLPLSEYSDAILEACERHAYQPRYKDETKIQKIVEGGASYFQELIESSGKQVLSEIEGTIVDNIVMSLKSSFPQYFQDAKHLDIFYQVPIYFRVQDVECKSLLDILIIDHREKRIRPIDIKTMAGGTHSFSYRAKLNGYPTQASFYNKGLSKLLAGMGSTITDLQDVINKIKPEFEDWKIDDFKFIMDSTDYKQDKITGEVSYYQGQTRVATISNELLLLAEFGRPESFISAFDNEENAIPIKFKEIVGWRDALKLYTWYEEHGYGTSKHLVESNGEIVVE